jgi:hypothetical protein
MLSPDEVQYIIQKKVENANNIQAQRERAAKTIQKWYRRKHMRLNRTKLEEELKAAAGLNSDDSALLHAYITEEELNKRKAEIKKLRERIEERFGANPMRFYDMPIDEERKT